MDFYFASDKRQGNFYYDIFVNNIYKLSEMKTALEIDLSFDQILSIVRQLSKEDKIKLTQELEKEVIESNLSRVLKSFRTDELDLSTVNEEVEIVRKEIYDKKTS